MEAPAEQQPPRGTKRPPADGDVYKASGARRYDFVDDDDEEGGGGGSSRDDTGFLDENGTFVERAARGGTKEDAWLGPADADADAAAPTATKRARKALRKQEEDERLVDDLVASSAVFDIKKRMVGILEPGETVPRALRRLKGLGGRMDAAARRAFDELTDAAAELFDRGDLDAYSHYREAFEEAAWAYEYSRRARASASASAQEVEEGYQAAATTRDYVDAGAETATDVGAGGQAVDPDQPDTPGDASGTAAVEAGEGAGVGGWDYVYDPASGYYYSSSTGYFYDSASGCYCSASTGSTWFYYDHDEGQCSRTGKELQP